MKVERVPLRRRVRVSREMVSPEAMPEEVQLFSIPGLDATGGALTETSAHIESGKLRLRGGEVLLSRLNPRKARIALVGDLGGLFGVCSPEFIALEAGPDLDHRFLAYWLAAESTRQSLDSAVRSVTRSHQRVETGELLDLCLPDLSLDDQRRIADFLDDQVTRIDRITAARESQIQEIDGSVLEVARTVVSGTSISGGVRVSGIPWAPHIPTRWGSPRVCQVARMGTGHTPSRSEAAYWEDCTIPWLTTADVHRFRHDEIDSISSTEFLISEVGLANSAAVLHPAGTVALSRTASAGFSIVMDVDMATSQDYATWTCGPRLLNTYLLWCLRAMREDLLRRLAMGSTHKTIYFPDLMSIKVPLPSLEEQAWIVHELGTHADAARLAVSKLRGSVDLLAEYKRSLITAAVTGAIDVTTKRLKVLT